MSRVISLAAVILVLALCVAQASAGPEVVDPEMSDRLTTYLHHHRLPDVGAQVSTPEGDSGGRHVLLYGYVATPYGKTDAVEKSRKFLNDSPIEVTNSILVDPQIKKLKSPPPPSTPAAQDAEAPTY